MKCRFSPNMNVLKFRKLSVVLMVFSLNLQMNDLSIEFLVGRVN